MLRRQWVKINSVRVHSFLPPLTVQLHKRHIQRHEEVMDLSPRRRRPDDKNVCPLKAQQFSGSLEHELLCHSPASGKGDTVKVREKERDWDRV